jgi:hypothetical protein
MRSPFPGMDPYIEAPDIWPDFHDALAAEIRRQLNLTLPAPYYARLEMRPEVGIVGDETHRRILPDVSVQRPMRPVAATSASVALLDAPRTDVSESLQVNVPAEPIRHHFIEVRDSQRAHVLVTLIEIVSPSNKRPGSDRLAYEDKQREVLDSDASLIEIDLLRGGRPVVGGMYVHDAIDKLNPKPDYLVVVSRGWQRGAQLGHQLFPFTVRQPLPCIPVPLRDGEPEVPLDLQYVLRLAYDSGPYHRGAVDYTQPPNPPLPPEHATWAQELLLVKPAARSMM